MKHNPEFMMAEWYRMDFTLEEMIEDTVHFIRLFIGPLPYHIISYRELFLRETGIDYVAASEQDLIDFIQTHSIPFYPSIMEERDEDALLNLILGSQIEAKLGN